MDWPDERYVRLYTRDSVTWSLWPWESRALFCLLLRKVDRAGLLDLGGHSVEDAVAVTVNMPPDVVKTALVPLCRSGTVTVTDETLVIPEFMTAQEARSSDKQRQRDSRERRRAKAMSHEDGDPVTECDRKSPAVTPGHTESPTVTLNLAVPSLAVPSLKTTAPDGSENLELIPGDKTANLDSAAALTALWGDGEEIRSPITKSKKPRGFTLKDKKRLRALVAHIRAREGCAIAEAHDLVRVHWKRVVVGHDGDLRKSDNFWLAPNSYDYSSTPPPTGPTQQDAKRGTVQIEHFEKSGTWDQETGKVIPN